MLPQSCHACCWGGRATSPQSPGDSLRHGAALGHPGGDAYGPVACPAKFHLTPFLWNYSAPFLFAFFFSPKSEAVFSITAFAA